MVEGKPLLPFCFFEVGRGVAISEKISNHSMLCLMIFFGVEKRELNYK
jgi:hypothetical protein